MLACAYLAAVYLTRDAERDGDEELVAWFRRRALATGIVSLWALWRDRFVVATIATAAAVTAVMWAWATAQYPDILPGELTPTEAASGGATLIAMLIALYVVFQRDEGFGADRHEPTERQ